MGTVHVHVGTVHMLGHHPERRDYRPVGEVLEAVAFVGSRQGSQAGRETVRFEGSQAAVAVESKPKNVVYVYDTLYAFIKKICLQ